MSFLGDLIGGIPIIGPAVSGLFEDDPSFPMGSDGGFDISSILNPIGDMFSTVTGGFKNVLDSFGLSGKDVFSAASAAVPYFFTTEGQKEANLTNIAEAEKTRAFGREMFQNQLSAQHQLSDMQYGKQVSLDAIARSGNAALAREQMGFLREMGSTQWQRAVDDMKAAGLSPMLAYSKGGNVGGSPVGGFTSGGSAGMGNVGLPSGGQARVESGVPAAFQSAYQMGMMRENLEQARATTAKLQEDTRTSKMTGDLHDIQRVWFAKDTERVHEMVKQVVAQTNLYGRQAERVESEIMRNIRAGNWDEVRRAMEELRMRGEYLKSESLKGFRGVYYPYIDDVSKGINAASQAARALRFRAF